MKSYVQLSLFEKLMFVFVCIVIGVVITTITIGLFFSNTPLSKSNDFRVECTYFFLASGTLASLMFFGACKEPPKEVRKKASIILGLFVVVLSLFLLWVFYL